LKRLSTGSVDDLLLQQKQETDHCLKRYITITINGQYPAKYEQYLSYTITNEPR
jgi:hypothetical protein